MALRSIAPRRGRTPHKPGAPTAQVQSLTRGLSILEALAQADSGLSLTEVGHRVQLPVSTAHRLLATLEKMGYVYQAGDLGLWHVGLQAFTVGSTFLANRDFIGRSHARHRDFGWAELGDEVPGETERARRSCSHIGAN